MSNKNLTDAEEKEFDRLIKKLGWTPIRRFWFGGDTYMTGPLYSEACFGMPDELHDFADEVDFLVVGYHADDDIWERIAELEAEDEDEEEEEDDE